MSLKKLNLNIYEYNNGLYVSAGDNNRVFGYSNEELRNVLGLRVNKELYLAYFIIYNIITEFYSDTMSSTYAEFIRLEDIIKNVDKTTGGIVDKSAGLVLDEVEENSFKQIALTWDELLEIEKKANRMIWENLEIYAGFPSQEELAKMDYRSKKKFKVGYGKACA